MGGCRRLYDRNFWFRVDFRSVSFDIYTMFSAMGFMLGVVLFFLLGLVGLFSDCCLMRASGHPSLLWTFWGIYGTGLFFAFLFLSSVLGSGELGFFMLTA